MEIKIISIIVLVVCLLGIATGNTFNGEKHYDKYGVRQITKCLIKAIRNRDFWLSNLSAQKRNSEIINSILGLPKNLNDAGRK